MGRFIVKDGGSDEDRPPKNYFVFIEDSTDAKRQINLIFPRATVFEYFVKLAEVTRVEVVENQIIEILKGNTEIFDKIIQNAMADKSIQTKLAAKDIGNFKVLPEQFGGKDYRQ